MVYSKTSLTWGLWPSNLDISTNPEVFHNTVSNKYLYYYDGPNSWFLDDDVNDIINDCNGNFWNNCEFNGGGFYFGPLRYSPPYYNLISNFDGSQQRSILLKLSPVYSPCTSNLALI